MMLLANSGKALQRSPNCQEFGSEVRFQAGGPAASDMIAEFANSIIIGTQIYGRLRNWMPTATDTISFGTDWKEVFHSVARWSSYTIYVPVIGVKSKLTECV
jgi:hypothetical protein